MTWVTRSVLRTGEKDTHNQVAGSVIHHQIVETINVLGNGMHLTFGKRLLGLV